MEILKFFMLLIVTVYATLELGTLVYIIVNRKTAVPRIRSNLRYFLGIDGIERAIRQKVSTDVVTSTAPVDLTPILQRLKSSKSTNLSQRRKQ